MPSGYYKYPVIKVFVTRNCGCGCGGTFKCRIMATNTPQRFIRGHQRRGKKLTKKQLKKMIEGQLKFYRENPDASREAKNTPQAKENYRKSRNKFIEKNPKRQKYLNNRPEFKKSLSEGQLKFNREHPEFRKEIANRPEVRKKNSEGVRAFHESSEENKLIWELSCFNPVKSERFRRSFGFINYGPPYFRSIADFILLAVEQQRKRVAELKKLGVEEPELIPGEASERILKFMKEKGYTIQDVEIFLNFFIGHTQWCLATRYNVSTQYIYKLITKFMIDFPGIVQTGPTPSRMLANDVWVEMGITETKKQF